MTSEKQIAAQFGCSELAAREICTAAQAAAQSFVAIYDAYDLTHVLDAKRAIAKSSGTRTHKTFKGSRAEKEAAARADRLRQNWRALSRPSSDLFKCAQVAHDAAERFRTAVGIANCQNYIGIEAALTATLAALHGARELASAIKVADGRLAYDALLRDHALLRSLGILA